MAECSMDMNLALGQEREAATLPNPHALAGRLLQAFLGLRG